MAVKKTRVTVEQAFGSFKKRSHSMHGELRISVENVPAVVLALAVLHNLAIKWGDINLMYDTEDPGVQPDEIEIGTTGNETRRNMIKSCF